jgi:hypothetical protein
MPFLTTTSDVNSYPFDLRQLQKASEPYYDPGSYFGGRLNFGLSDLTDTVKIVISQKHSDPITTNQFVDTLIFIRTKNSR